MSEAESTEQQARILLVGNANVDVLMGPLAPWPATGTEVVVDSYELRVGGAAGNTALALAALASGRQGAYDVIASVGDDGMGRWLEHELAGVAELTRCPEPTAVTVGLNHPGGQRTFVSYLGHLTSFPERRLEEALAGARPGDLLLLCGYFLMPTLRQLAPDLLRQAADLGVLTVLDTGWPTEGWTEPVKREVGALLPLLTVFTPNREELLGLAGVPDAGEYEADAVKRAVDDVRSLDSQRLLVKLGALGALYVGPDGTQEASAPAVRVADTVGAGDTFNAALLTAVARGLDWRDALGPAVTAASLAVASSPRRYPGWDELPTGARVGASVRSGD